MNSLQSMQDFSLFADRRNRLCATIRQQYPQVKDGLILLFAGFERDRTVFRQESSFYYFSGIKDPSVVLAVDIAGKTTVYIPHHEGKRDIWVDSEIPLVAKNIERLCVDAIEHLGKPCSGYQLHPFFKKDHYSHLLEKITTVVANGGTIFVLNPYNEHEYVEQRLVLGRLQAFVPGLQNATQDISSVVAAMRRIKDQRELEQLYGAIQVTQMAQEAAARTIAEGVYEAEVQAGIEHVMTAAMMQPSFPSIVATGHNATILHYMARKSVLNSGELVVIDIGAENEFYCADITRTYPVSGSFTARQQELYQIVLDTQEYIAQLAKPGIWLKNKEKPEQSLHHLAQKYLASRGGYDKYFPHGIGHYLGLDVHDVGDYSTPLQKGDVITIEPGIYIPEESIGIRIEDNYWITDGGAVCLSELIPKSITEIEQMVSQGFDDEDEFADDLELEDDAALKDMFN